MQLNNISSTAPRRQDAATEAARRQNESANSRSPKEADEVSSEGQIKEEQAITAAEMEKVVESLKAYAGWGNFSIGFEEDEETNSMVVNIIDRDSGEVIKQIPPEEILQLRSQMRRILGLIFDQLA